MKTVGENIKRCCKMKSITQKDLAKMAGISKETVSRIVTGREVPRLSTLKHIAISLNITVDELFSGNF